MERRLTIDEVATSIESAIHGLDDEIRQAMKEGHYAEATRLTALQCGLKTALIHYQQAKAHNDPPPFGEFINES
jgi:hypothetical protein